MKYKIHPTSEVQTDEIGAGTTIWQYVVILKNAVIGKDCNISFNVFIENDVIIGNNVTVKSGVYLWDGIRVEDDVHIGPNVTFINDKYPRSKQYSEYLARFEQTFIKKGASIGAASVILAGLTIGEKAMIGAGSVVTKDVPPFTVWYGNPASQRGYVTEEGTVLSLDLLDKQGEKYKLINQEPVLDD
jgi:UDP-2-acetamido-3-amino-2,3-dideoxy-glucuronate N-acetyltransferase